MRNSCQRDPLSPSQINQGFPYDDLRGRIAIACKGNGLEVIVIPQHSEEIVPQLLIPICQLCFVKNEHCIDFFLPSFHIFKVGGITTRLFYLIDWPLTNPNDIHVWYLEDMLSK